MTGLEPEENWVRFAVEDHVAILTFQRPSVLNALNQAVMAEFSQWLDEIAANAEIRVLLITGEGRAFVAGADISQMRDLDRDTATQVARQGQAVFSKLERMPQPTIALIHGFALGGGMELAMACDLRIAAEGTQFGQPEVCLGIVPGFGGTQRLSRIVGRGRALELLLIGHRIDAQEAYRIGLVNRVVPADELLAAGRETAQQLMAVGPIAQALIKRAVYEGTDLPLDAGLEREAELFGDSFATEDRREGMAAFLERRKPQFRGR